MSEHSEKKSDKISTYMYGNRNSRVVGSEHATCCRNSQISTATWTFVVSNHLLVIIKDKIVIVKFIHSGPELTPTLSKQMNILDKSWFTQMLVTFNQRVNYIPTNAELITMSWSGVSL